MTPHTTASPIPAARRRHVHLALLGTAISWSLAALVACASPGHPQALYEQLGGVAALEGITDRTLDRVAADPATNRSFKDVKMSTLKKSVAAYVCKVADGPCVYEGETMRNAHSQTANTGAEFDSMVTILRDELNKAGVPTAAKNELLRRLAPTRRDIVLQ